TRPDCARASASSRRPTGPTARPSLRRRSLCPRRRSPTSVWQSAQAPLARRPPSDCPSCCIPKEPGWSVPPRREWLPPKKDLVHAKGLHHRCAERIELGQDLPGTLASGFGPAPQCRMVGNALGRQQGAEQFLRLPQAGAHRLARDGEALELL